jgi:hypothetical protein
VRTYVDVSVMLTEGERFDFIVSEDGPGRPAVKLRVHSVTLMAADNPALRRGVRLSGRRFRQDGTRGDRRWSGPATLDQMPPHVHDALLKAKELLP